MTLVSHLHVTADPLQPQRGTLRCGDMRLPCVLGRAGVRRDKHEGDGATPVGTFSLRHVLYRADRVSLPPTHLNATPIARDDGWCDDPADASYNKPVKLPYAASAEHMWRDDRMYDVVVVLGHNDDPIVPGNGSALFMHIASEDGTPTAGCIALTPDDFLRVLQSVSASSVLEVQSA